MAVKFWIKNALPSLVLGSDTAWGNLPNTEGQRDNEIGTRPGRACADVQDGRNCEHFVRCNLPQKLALERLADDCSIY